MIFRSLVLSSNTRQHCTLLKIESMAIGSPALSLIGFLGCKNFFDLIPTNF
jgi:hypothetical protein